MVEISSFHYAEKYDDDLSSHTPKRHYICGAAAQRENACDQYQLKTDAIDVSQARNSIVILAISSRSHVNYTEQTPLPQNNAFLLAQMPVIYV